MTPAIGESDGGLGFAPNRSGQFRPDSAMRVRMNAGHNTLTPTPGAVIAHSWASDSEIATTACLVALYAAMNGAAFSPASDAVFTTCPSPCSTSRGTNDRMPCTTPMRLTPIVHSQPASGTSQVRPPAPPTPALLQITWAVPKRSNVAAANASTCAASL